MLLRQVVVTAAVLGFGCSNTPPPPAAQPVPPPPAAQALPPPPAAAPAAPEPAPASSALLEIRAEILDAGAVNLKNVGKKEASDTQAGTVNVVDPQANPTFLPGGTAIKAAVGTKFGISVRLSGAPPEAILPVSTRVTHPLIKDPKTGKSGTEDTWESPMNVGIPRFTGWSFDNAWEIVPGRWTIELLHGDSVLAAKDFTVSKRR